MEAIKRENCRSLQALAFVSVDVTNALLLHAFRPAYLSPALIEAVLLTGRYGSSGIKSLHLMPNSKTQVLCQMRNNWVVVIDYLLGSVIKLHTFLRGMYYLQKPIVRYSSLAFHC